MTTSPFILILLQLTYFTVIGFAACQFFSRKLKNPMALGLQVSAPLIGVLISIWTQSLSLRFGIGQRNSLLAQLFIAVLIIGIGISKRKIRKNVNIHLLKATVIIFLIYLTSLFLHYKDYHEVGLYDYFPVTNGDTFSYLGQIDQIRFAKKLLPPIEYPAGYSPQYLHAVYLRSGVAALVAGQAELFNIETHVAFFSMIRMTLIFVAIGVFSLILLFSKSYFFATMGTFMFCGGNFMFHQVFQQFLSSSFGVVCAIELLILMVLTIEKKYKFGVVLLLGLASGIFGLTSPEAQFFILLGFFIFLIMSTLKISSSLLPPKRPISCCGLYLVGFCLGAFPLLPYHYIQLAQQSLSRIHAHPGDWIARIGYLTQASGVVPFYTGLPVSQHSHLVIGGVIAISFLVVIGTIYLVLSPLTIKEGRSDGTQYFMLGVVSLTVLIVFAMLMIQGKGYVMLKSFDYHCFIPAIIIPVSLYRFMTTTYTTTHRRWKTIAVKGALLIFVLCFIFLAIPKKSVALNYYGELAKKSPPLEMFCYEDETKAKITGIVPDLQKVDLFLYMNRWLDVPIDFTSSVTHRYFYQKKRSVNFSHVFRMGQLPFHTGFPVTGGAYFLDVNRRRTQEVPSLSELVPAKNYLMVLQKGSNWLPPEGDSLSNISRWLSKDGRFRIFSLSNEDNTKRLNIHISPGPDLRPFNSINIMLGGTTIQTIAPSQLPARLRILLPIRSCDKVDGMIRIVGDNHGLRQVRVSEIYIDSIRTKMPRSLS